MPRRPRISVITPTFRREDLLARCVDSVLAQEVDADVEHLVVNDYGEPLTRAAWMDDPRVTVLDTHRTERSVARNTGAALSRGDWLYFLDDDDYALPGAFAAMLEVAERTGAAHVYGSYEVINEETGSMSLIAPETPPETFALQVAGETFPLQASWLRRDAFFATGGFDPLFFACEDMDLLRRVAMNGTVARTAAVVARVRVDHPQTTTTDDTLMDKRWAESLERCLDHPRTFALVSGQVQGAPYWRGRCARIYLVSAVKNLRQRRYGRVGGRLIEALRLTRSGSGGRAEFRRGLLRRP